MEIETHLQRLPICRRLPRGVELVVSSLYGDQAVKVGLGRRSLLRCCYSLLQGGPRCSASSRTLSLRPLLFLADRHPSFERDLCTPRHVLRPAAVQPAQVATAARGCRLPASVRGQPSQLSLPGQPPKPRPVPARASQPATATRQQTTRQAAPASFPCTYAMVSGQQAAAEDAWWKTRRVLDRRQKCFLVTALFFMCTREDFLL